MNNKWNKSYFGKHNNQTVYLFKYKDNNGSYVEITNYGAIIKSIYVPDNKGGLKNVVLGFSTLQGYQDDTCYIGATIGRFANRIKNASFTYNNEDINLEANDGLHQNHGGKDGFNSKIFDYEIKGQLLVLSLKSASGESGFPGDVQFEVHYKWDTLYNLSICYFARATKVTPLNFTNHCYFNLTGSMSKIWDHFLKIDATEMLDTDSEFIPNGKIISSNYPVNHKSLGENLQAIGRGMNSYFIRSQKSQDQKDKIPICSLYEPHVGIRLDVYTSYPGVQIYTGDFLNGNYNKNQSFQPFQGICLECQFYPDSPNHEHFSDTFLIPGKIYRQEIIYSFETISG
ncbi:aldose epimerase family protein [Galbibacter pacificus]|uniref:Aldose 1-epimerase n=1 Tax=Galbibacter pacificus TaxID=2996052 RepID=A0ABT6FN22_9FLAO|nr:aldose epimerase family protein [Galbibacter pacificus]MDG3581094.1 galactose mutarotase [Galbibacter pacificus]MDG3584572.1 galactose mutarotase [Galbibacter pacificus]